MELVYVRKSCIRGEWVRGAKSLIGSLFIYFSLIRKWIAQF
uniref:Uncharacterized protein n=1 Tax=Rhizophora mucronata TaxID=61149 RepID=A0A2P2NNY0_RHIMU